MDVCCKGVGVKGGGAARTIADTDACLPKATDGSFLFFSPNLTGENICRRLRRLELLKRRGRTSLTKPFRFTAQMCCLGTMRSTGGRTESYSILHCEPFPNHSSPPHSPPFQPPQRKNPHHHAEPPGTPDDSITNAMHCAWTLRAVLRSAGVFLACRAIATAMLCGGSLPGKPGKRNCPVGNHLMPCHRNSSPPHPPAR